MTLLGSVDIPFTKSTKIAVDATDTAGQAATVAQQATDTAGQAQATAQTASQTATQAAATAAGAAQAAQTAITTANGKNKAYYGATTPISPKSGDIWFVEDSSGNVTSIKHYDGTQWVTDVDNTALAQQISAAQAAADNAATVGQTAQQVAQQAAQVGDSAAKAAEAAQQAANAAQTDAANAVSKNDVINQINISTEGILIDGKKVHITGQTTIDNAVIKDAMIDSMTANKLTAGTIDANVINVKNINASNIVTGTLDASKATVTNIDASKITTGTLNAARIAAGSIDASKLAAGTITAASGVIGSLDASKITTGTLDAARIAAGSIDASKINVSSLSALSADLGNITGGSININNNFIVDRNGNLTANNGTFTGNVRSVSDKYSMGAAFYSGGLYTVYTSNSGPSFTGEYDNGSITITEYPISLPFDKSNIYKTIQEGAGNQNYVTRILAGRINLYALTTPGDFNNSKNFYIERGKNRTAIYSNDDMEVSAYGNLILDSGNIYLTPSGKVYFGDTINIGNNIDLSWNSFNNSLEFSEGIKSGNVLLNGNTMQVNNIVLDGAHSIISNDGGQLYFTDPGGNRIDITVNQVHADKWVMPNNMQVGYHTIQTNDNGDLWFNGSNGSRIDIHVGTLYYSGSLSKSSSEAIKTNIEPMNFSALDEIMKTDFYSYNYISDLEKGVTKPNFGPVIGDSYRLSDKFLTQDARAVSIDSMTAINSQAIKELYEDMQGKNQDLLLKIADLETRLAKLEA